MDGNSTGPVAPQCSFTDPVTWHPSLSSVATRIASVTTIVITGIAMPFTILSNGFLIFVVLRKSSLRSKQRVMVVFYLLITDFFTGLFSYPLFIIKEADQLGSAPPNCYVVDVFFLSMAIFSGTSFLHIVLVAFERHTAISKAFHYDSIITVPRLTRASISLWIFMIIYYGIYFTLAQLPNHQSFETVFFILDSLYFVGVSVAFLTVVYWYTRIFQTLRKLQHRQIQDTRHLSTVTARNRDIQKSRRTVFTNLIQAFGFLVPSALFTVTYLLTAVLGSHVRSSLFFTIASVSDALLLLNSSMNPIVFCLRTAEFKEECRKVVRMIRRSNEVGQLPREVDIARHEVQRVRPNQDQIVPRSNVTYIERDSSQKNTND